MTHGISDSVQYINPYVMNLRSNLSRQINTFSMSHFSEIKLILHLPFVNHIPTI